MTQNIIGNKPAGGGNELLHILGDTIYEYEIYDAIDLNATGTVTIPTEAVVSFAQYHGGADCLVSKKDAVTGKPTGEPVYTSGGAVVTGTIDASGNFTTTGQTENAVLVYQIQIKARHKENISLNNIINETTLYSTDNIENRSTVEGNTLTDALDSFQNDRNIQKEPTGFVDPENVIIEYDGVARTITLSGTVEAYYRGVKIDALFDGWESDPHDIADGEYFLLYNGTAFLWKTTPWNFADLMIAFVFRDTANFCLRECHGFMPWQSHKEFHEVIGTYLNSGGDIASYVLNSTTATDRRPDISEALIYDEDLPTVLPTLNNKLYTWLQLSGANNTIIVADNSEFISVTSDQPNWNEFTGGVWTQAAFPINAYGKVFVMAVPVTADAECQKSRFVFIQPQFVSTNLSAVQSRSPQNVNLGHIATALAEYVFIGEIIIRFTANDWRLIEVNKLSGSRFSQVASPLGAFLTAVASDDSLIGNGTASSPLGLSGTYTPPADSTTAVQITKADGTTPVVNFDTDNGKIEVIANDMTLAQEERILFKGFVENTPDNTVNSAIIKMLSPDDGVEPATIYTMQEDDNDSNTFGYFASQASSFTLGIAKKTEDNFYNFEQVIQGNTSGAIFSKGIFSDKLHNVVNIAMSTYTPAAPAPNGISVVNVAVTTSTITIPEDVPIGGKILIRKLSSTGTITINRSGTDVFTRAALTSLTLTSDGDFWTLEKVTATRWELVDGYESGVSGYNYFTAYSDGKLICHGESDGTGTVAVSFAKAFQSDTGIGVGITNTNLTYSSLISISATGMQITAERNGSNIYSAKRRYTATGRWYA